MDPKRPQADAELARLSVRLPKGSLTSSLATSSRYFLDYREAQHISNWLTDDESIRSPATPPSPSTMSSLKFVDRAVVRTSQPVRTSIILGAVPYDAMRPSGPEAAATESREKLQLFPGSGSDAGNVADQSSVTREDGQEYATGLKLALIITALCFSVFLMALGKLRFPPGRARRLPGSSRQLHHRDRPSAHH